MYTSHGVASLKDSAAWTAVSCKGTRELVHEEWVMMRMYIHCLSCQQLYIQRIEMYATPELPSALIWQVSTAADKLIVLHYTYFYSYHYSSHGQAQILIDSKTVSSAQSEYITKMYRYR